MTALSWKEFAEFIGIGAIVASLIFVGLQMQQAESIARYEFFSGVDAPADFVEAWKGNEDLWLKGCADGDLTDAEMLIFLRLSSMLNLARNAQMNRVRLLDLPISEDYPAYRMALDLYSNPGLKTAWTLQATIAQQNRESPGATGEWSAMVEQHLEAIEREPPDLLTSGPRCGMP